MLRVILEPINGSAICCRVRPSRPFTSTWRKPSAAADRALVVGIADPSKDFHSFRHTFKLAARACGIAED